MNLITRKLPFHARKLLLLTSLSLGLGGATSLMAQTTTAPAGAASGNTTTPTDHSKQPDAQDAHRLSFQRADANNDGKLSREEAQNLPAIFEKYNEWDHDGDGNISEKEFLDRASTTSSK